MMICIILIVLITILEIRRLMILSKVYRAKKDGDFSRKIVLPSKANHMACLLMAYIMLGLMLFVSDKGAIFIIILASCLFGGLSIWEIWSWPKRVILYNENDFIIGWSEKNQKKYLYSEITNILKGGGLQAILIGPVSLQSDWYTKDFLEFKRFILEKSLSDHSICSKPAVGMFERNERTDAARMVQVWSFLILGVFLQILGINVLLGDKSFLLLGFLFIAIGILCIAIGWSRYDIYYKKCTFCEAGLNIRYPFQEQKVIPWKDFKEICLCYWEDYNAKNRLHEKRPILCFVKYGEKKNQYGHWKVGDPFHYRNVICVDYTEERYLEVIKYSKKVIVDMRGMITYLDNDVEKELL